MSYDFRRLRVNDLGMMRGLNAVFSRAFDDPDAYESAPPSDAYLAAQLARTDLVVLGACAGDEVVGGIGAYTLQKLEQERSEVYIYDLAVDEAHRRKRVATQLIEMLRSIARLHGSYVIYVQADLVDAPAIALYASLGTREDVLHYDIN